MTIQDFDNQKWYKGIKIKYEGGEYFVWRIDFGLNRVQISYKSRLESSLIWLLYTEFTIVQDEPTALDLISAERDKQIRKGYTVEHDQLFYPECQLAAIASDLCFPYEIEQAPEPPVPINWHPVYWKKLINLPYEDRLRIAGAMIAGELDRIIHLENKES